MNRRDPRTTAADLGDGWVKPSWMLRSAAAAGASPVAGTTVGWTSIGNLYSDRRAAVDPRGLVSPWADDWSLDWWIGAEDRWHVPSREANVRQALLGGAPVVETRMRVPGGDIVHRAWALRSATAGGNEELLVVEVENASSVPVALALAIRPYGVRAMAPIDEIAVHDTVVTIDGRVALHLPRPASAVVAGDGSGGDCAEETFSGATAVALPTGYRDAFGRASAALVFALTHTSTLRVVLPLAEQDATRSERRIRSRVEAARPDIAALPGADAVSRGWSVQVDRGLRAVVPDRRLQDALDANRRHLLLAHGIDRSVAAAATLDRFGFHAEAAETLAELPARQRANGAFRPDVDGVDEARATTTALSALADHCHLTHDAEFLVAAVPAVAGAAQWLDRERRRGRLVPGAAEVAALRSAARMLDDAGEDAAAITAAHFADEAAAAVDPLAPASGSSADPTPDTETALARMLAEASSTWTWSAGDDGHATGAITTFCDLVRDALVGDSADGLALAPVFPRTWYGQGVEAHGVPTTHGRLSFAVRWHGSRPALLWELTPHGAPSGEAEAEAEDAAGIDDAVDGRGPRITCPGLDPAWSTDLLRGEALLAEPPHSMTIELGSPSKSG